MTRQERRARFVGRRIRAAIKDGTFRLMSGYLAYVDGGECYGCAISAAAFALSGAKIGGGESCRSYAVKSGRMTVADAINLESGYEGWHRTPNTYSDGKYTNMINERSAFYRLGRELRKERVS